jgi:membrane-associated protease RseP (regulator of RpoE activity)
MLHEPASRSLDRSLIPEVPEIDEREGSSRTREDERLPRIREFVSEIFIVSSERTPYDSTTPEVTTTDSLRLRLPESSQGRSEIEENVAPLVLNPESYLIVIFEGQLKLDSEAAYAQLDERLAPMNLLALFRQPSGTEANDEDPFMTGAPARESTQPSQRIYIVEGRVNPKPRSWIPNLVLFLITLMSVLYVGMEMAISEIAYENPIRAFFIANNGLQELWRGLPYAISIMLILGAHELGHYFAARRRGVSVTLPYFLPFPTGLFGTFGAFIQMRQPIRNRKWLLEIGAAGPLAGLVFAIPILLVGLATSRVEPPLASGIVEGNSVLYALAKILVFGRFLPDGSQDVIVNQLAWAGWTGLFVTGLNLLPLGQLDGGHVLYSLLGHRARMLYFPLMAILTFLVIVSGGALLLLLLLLFFLGRAYAVPLDDITPLSKNHRLLALGTLLIFFLVFVPVPLSPASGGSSPFPPPDSGSAALMVSMVIVLAQRLRR